MQFIANDELGKDRCTFYNLHNNKGKQAVSDTNPQYDLLQYPLFFPEGGHVRMGWSEKIKKVLDPWTTIWSVYSRLLWHKNQPFQKDISIPDMMKEINKLLPMKVRAEDFEYELDVDKKNPYVSMKQFYNFLLQERAGEIKPKYFTPLQELHQYKRSCNLKRSVATRMPLKAENEVWTEKIEHEGETYIVCAHPYSRQICCRTKNEAGKTCYHPLPCEYRKEEKKNPVLYGERLKLFYLCDQGVKIENNNLRFHEKKEQQAKYNRVNFKCGEDCAEKGEKIEQHGRRYMLPSSYSHGKRAYAQRCKFYIRRLFDFFPFKITTRWRFVCTGRDQICS